jgi:hypothetical protein
MRREFVGSGLIGVASVTAALGSLGYGCGQNSFGTCADNGTCADADAGDASVAPPDAIVVTWDAPPADVGSLGLGEERDDGGAEGGDGGAEESDRGDGGLDAATDASDANPCAVTGDPSVTPCVVDDAYGVFVSAASGQNDAGTPGTKSAPWKTITEGIRAAAASGKSRVYICAGGYAEPVVLDANHDGISLYGGFDCPQGVWTWSGDKALVNVPSALYALRINATTMPISVEDIAFMAPDAMGQDPSGNGNSSIAAFFSNASGGVNLLRVALQAGAGTDGSAGAPPMTNWFSANAGDLQGNGADGGAGGPQKDCPCKQWGDSMGGAGGAGSGDPSVGGGDGGAGISNPVATPKGARDGVGGLGADPNTPRACTGGDYGADGVARMDGGAGAQVLGAVGPSGWVPASGASGVTGNPGQGAGGGGGGAAAGGGGGGCGGCGGAGGNDGHGGGASVALLVFDTQVKVQASILTTTLAGNGGPGSAAESGGGGGGGGNIGACGGGLGGGGGGGQGGGGGAGGVSVAVLYDSSSGVLIDMTTRFMQPLPTAIGGPGGDGGTGGSTGNGGLPGSAGMGGTVRQTLPL